MNRDDPMFKVGSWAMRIGDLAERAAKEIGCYNDDAKVISGEIAGRFSELAIPKAIEVASRAKRV